MLITLLGVVFLGVYYSAAVAVRSLSAPPAAPMLSAVWR